MRGTGAGAGFGAPYPVRRRTDGRHRPFTEECIANVVNQLRVSDQLTVCMICNDVQTIRYMNCPVKILEEGRLFDVRDTAVQGGVIVPAVVASFRRML